MFFLTKKCKENLDTRIRWERGKMTGTKSIRDIDRQDERNERRNESYRDLQKDEYSEANEAVDVNGRIHLHLQGQFRIGNLHPKTHMQTKRRFPNSCHGSAKFDEPEIDAQSPFDSPPASASN